MTDLKRAIGLAEILHSDLQLSKAEQKEAGVMLRELVGEIERKDALLRQSLEVLEDLYGYRPDIDVAVIVIKEELK